MKFLKFNKPKTKAQAMVEFAIALPILLLLLYGIIEVGRLLFLYSTVVTASRQAARYGATTGEGLTPGVPRYQDCAGIRDAAKKFGILRPFADNQITIQYDNPDDPIDKTQHTYCPAGGSATSTTPDEDTLSDNKHRITVTVQDQFTPLVKLVPLSPRTVSSTSSRTIFIKVPVVVQDPEEYVTQNPTIIMITSHDPDPSQMDQDIVVTFKVVDANDANEIPTGTVIIADSVNPTTTTIKCEYELKLADDGVGSCTIKNGYPTAGVKTLTAVYGGDIKHVASDTATAHTVDLANTVTIITPTSPDPSLEGATVNIVVTVTGGITKPTGTVDVSAGGKITCTITLADGAGSCPLTFNKTGHYNITATYSGDSTHKPSSDLIEPHEVLISTPTPTLPPTSTPISTATPIPTATPVPPTALPPGVCKVTYGLLQKSGNDLTMSLNNQTGLALEISEIFLQWNHDKGHQTGADKTLILQKASLAGVTFYTGPNPGPSVKINTPYPVTYLPIGNSFITFTFHQSFDNWDGTDQISITFANQGCSMITQMQH